MTAESGEGPEPSNVEVPGPPSGEGCLKVCQTPIDQSLNLSCEYMNLRTPAQLSALKSQMIPLTSNAAKNMNLRGPAQ